MKPRKLPVLLNSEKHFMNILFHLVMLTCQLTKPFILLVKPVIDSVAAKASL